MFNFKTTKSGVSLQEGDVLRRRYGTRDYVKLVKDHSLDAVQYSEFCFIYENKGETIEFGSHYIRQKYFPKFFENAALKFNVYEFEGEK